MSEIGNQVLTQHFQHLQRGVGCLCVTLLMSPEPTAGTLLLEGLTSVQAKGTTSAAKVLVHTHGMCQCKKLRAMQMSSS